MLEFREEFDMLMYKKDGSNGLDDVFYQIIYKTFDLDIRTQSLLDFYAYHEQALEAGYYMTENHRVLVQLLLLWNDVGHVKLLEEVSLDNLLCSIIDEGVEEYEE